MLARSFDDSPLFEFLFPKGPARLRITAGTFRGTLLDALPFDAVHVAVDGSGVLGAACWLPPEGYPITPRRQAWILARLARLVPWAATRLPTRCATSARPTRCTRRTCTGTSRSSASTRATRAKGSAAGSSTTPWTGSTSRGSPRTSRPTRSRNLAWYARRRFELRETLHPVRSGPPVWTMWRDPA